LVRRERLPRYFLAAARRCFVPLDGPFAAAACGDPMEHRLGDGVHPTPAGHELIARHWLQAVTA